MTAILAAHDKNGKLFIAGDRRRSMGGGQFFDTDEPKVNRQGPLLIGAAGLSIQNTVIRTLFPVPPRAEGQDHHSYIYDSVRRTLIHHLQEEMFFNKDSQGSKTPDGVSILLMGFENVLYNVAIVQDYLHIIQVPTPHGVGSGGCSAVSAFHALENIKDTRKRMTMAMMNCYKAVMSCGGDIDILQN